MVEQRLRPHRDDDVGGDVRAARATSPTRRPRAASSGSRAASTTAGAAHGIKVNLIAPAACTRMAGTRRRRATADADVAGARRTDGRVPRARGLPGQRRDLRGRRGSLRAHLHRVDAGLRARRGRRRRSRTSPRNWATINDETGYFVPADLNAWSATFMAHLPGVVEVSRPSDAPVHGPPRCHDGTPVLGSRTTFVQVHKFAAKEHGGV